MTTLCFGGWVGMKSNGERNTTVYIVTLNYLIQLTLLFIITLHHPNFGRQSNAKTQKSGSRLGSVEVRSGTFVTRHVPFLRFLKEKRQFRLCRSMRINGIIHFPKEKRGLALSSGTPGELFSIPERCALALNYSNSYRKTRTRELYTHSGRSAPKDTHPGQLIES